jgi:hypothetical protein
MGTYSFLSVVSVLSVLQQHLPNFLHNNKPTTTTIATTITVVITSLLVPMFSFAPAKLWGLVPCLVLPKQNYGGLSLSPFQISVEIYGGLFL